MPRSKAPTRLRALADALGHLNEARAAIDTAMVAEGDEGLVDIKTASRSVDRSHVALRRAFESEVERSGVPLPPRGTPS